MLKRLIVGPMATNCYILYFENNDCFIIDPGDNGQKISSFIDINNLKPIAILITHAHFDHIGAIDYLVHKYIIPVYAHIYSKDLFKDSKLNLSDSFGNPFTVKAPINYIEGFLNINKYIFEFILLEGHCMGSCMIYFQQNDLLFSGDVLFKGSIGRYDFPTSSHLETKKSLDIIKNFQFDATLLPGHGESSKLSIEQLNNPYLR